MSRVEEAMRRAAEAAQNPSAGSWSARPFVPPAGEDLESLAKDSFAIDEMPDRRHRRATPTHPQATATPAGPSATASTTAPPERATALLEHLDTRASHKVVIGDGMSSASREQYRLLAASLHHAQAASDIKVVMVASADVGEGKTLTTTNVSLTLSESYQRRVLLIDADLRRPSVHVMFGIENATGLSDGLAAMPERRIPVRQLTTRLSVLPAGAPTSDPMALLTSDRMRRLIDEARELFDWIIIDTPPVTLLPDANLLGAMVDRAVVVVRAGHTPFDLVDRAVRAIGRERALGVVLNCVDRVPSRSGYYGDYYYGAKQTS